MVIPNMVMKFHDFDIFYNICQFFDLSSALASRMESINIEWCEVALEGQGKGVNS